MACTKSRLRLRRLAGVAGALATLAAWPGPGQAQLSGVVADPVGTVTQTVGGAVGGVTGTITNPTQSTGSTQASGATAVVMGVVTNLTDSGTVTDPSAPVGAGQVAGSIPGLLSAEALHSAAMAWTDQATSQASLANLAMTVGGVGISAESLLSSATAVAGAPGTGQSSIDGLAIGGVPIAYSGAPNQALSLPGLSVVLNEQIQTANGIVVNALHVRTLDGLTDVVLGSAKAGI